MYFYSCVKAFGVTAASDSGRALLLEHQYADLNNSNNLVLQCLALLQISPNVRPLGNYFHFLWNGNRNEHNLKQIFFHICHSEQLPKTRRQLEFKSLMRFSCFSLLTPPTLDTGRPYLSRNLNLLQGLTGKRCLELETLFVCFFRYFYAHL